jgi:uncharacterized damage-inducible protein DinB
MPDTDISDERRDLLEALTVHRSFLVQTAADLDDDQARLRPTASSLSIGGLIKHVAATEQSWVQFMTTGSMGPDDVDMDWSNPDPAVVAAYEQGFELLADETLAGVLAGYQAVAAATDELVATLDLDRSFPLPPAPWFPEGATRSVRRTILHIIAETAQHAGHADIIRETIDGAKTMG